MAGKRWESRNVRRFSKDHSFENPAENASRKASFAFAERNIPKRVKTKGNCLSLSLSLSGWADRRRNDVKSEERFIRFSHPRLTFGHGGSRGTFHYRVATENWRMKISFNMSVTDVRCTPRSRPTNISHLFLHGEFLFPVRRQTRGNRCERGASQWYE